MILKNLQAVSKNNPGELIRLRDSAYAVDLLFTAIGHLNFFSWLHSSPSDFNGILNRFKIKERPTDVMLTYFKSLDLIMEKNGTFYITDMVKDFLTDDSEWNLIPYFSTQTERPVVEKMLEVLMTGKPAGWSAKKDESDWEKAMERDDFADMFTAGMDSRGASFAPGLAAGFDFSEFDSLLDVAGASGIYAACIKARFPEIRAAVLEKPPVDKIAYGALKKRELHDKIEVFGGNMFSDNLPAGFDIHLYSHAFHDWDTEQNNRLIKNSFQSLNRGGIIMIHDAHINREKTGPLSVAEYSVLLMFSTYGKCYSIKEIENMLLSGGFVDVAYQPTVGNRSVITGRKPE